MRQHLQEEGQPQNFVLQTAGFDARFVRVSIPCHPCILAHSGLVAQHKCELYKNSTTTRRATGLR